MKLNRQIWIIPLSLRGSFKTSPFVQSLRQALILILKILNVFPRLRSYPSLTLNKTQCFETTSLLVAFLVFFGGCNNTDSKNAGQVSQPETQVTTTTAKKGHIAKILSLTGTLIAFQEVRVTSKIPEKVQGVLVDVGSRVKPGDTLIQLEQRELALAVDQAEAGLANAKANLEICKTTFNRLDNLLKDKAISTMKYDDAKARLDIARAQVRQAGAALASAKEQLQNTIITSPIHGVVARKNVEVGEVVSPPIMPGKALLDVVDIRYVKTMVKVSENRVKEVSIGQETTITADGFPGEFFPGRISKISPIVDPRSRTFEVEVLIPNPESKLKPGMFARVELVLAKRTDVVMVPLKAVTQKDKSQVVFLAANGVARACDVKLGISDGVDVEVISGVTEGDKVIVQGNLGLKDGARIILKTSEKTTE